MSNAAIYARVSPARQKEQQTISSQTAALRAHARQLRLDVPERWVFCDEGHSGATLVRPALEKLRDLVAQLPVEVLVYSPDRLARKYAYQALLIEEFARAGTSVMFIKGPASDTPEDALLVQFQGMIAEYERAQIIERTRRGKTHRARQGTVNVLSGRRSATGTFARTSMPTPATRSSRTRRRLWLSCSAAMSRTARRSPAWPGG
jgi:DNA invertase Pin-like site-specific DNA recombinase